MVIVETLVDLKSINEVIYCHDFVKTMVPFSNKDSAHHFIQTYQMKLETFNSPYYEACFSPLLERFKWNSRLTKSIRLGNSAVLSFDLRYIRFNYKGN